MLETRHYQLNGDQRRKSPNTTLQAILTKGTKSTR